MSVLDALLEFDPGELRDAQGRWLRGATSPRHGAFKIGDRVTYETGSRGAGGHGDVTFTRQPGVHEVVGFQRNGNLRVREPKHGTTVDVHHTHAFPAPAPNEQRSDEMASGPLQRPTEAGMRRGREAAAAAQGVISGLTAQGWKRDETGRLIPPADVSGVGREGGAARARGASSLTTEHADTRDKLTNLPVGQSYGLHGPQGQVGRVERTAAGWEVYGSGATPERVHKTPSSAAGHAMRMQRTAASSRQQADVMARNYRHQQQVTAMNARQSQRAEAEAERRRLISSRRLSARDALGLPRARAQESAPAVLGALLEAERFDPAKHPRGPAGRFVELTEAGIRAAALKHNADYPESRGEIAKGRPVVRVNVSAASRRSSSGWRASITPGVVAPDGGVWAAQEPVAVPLRRFDGRLSGVDHAKRATKHLGLSGAKVPIEYQQRGLA